MPTAFVNGARFYYRLEGDPSLQPIVLVHPIGADLGLWDKVVPLLTPWSCVFRYDLRGHGGSESTSGEYSLDLMSSDLLALAGAVGMEKFSAVGVSLGGLTVINAAASQPHRVERVAVCSLAARMTPPPGGWDGRAQLVREKGMGPLGQPMVERMFSSDFRATTDPAIETMRSTLLRMDPEGYANACAVLRDADLTAVLSGLKQSVMVISGNMDALTPPNVGKAMADAIPAGRHVVLSGGHFPPLEQPSEFVDRLRIMFDRSTQ